jgi:hypothetical protein
MSTVKISRENRKGPVGYAARIYKVVEEGHQAGRSPRKISKSVREILGQVKEKDMAETATLLFDDLLVDHDLYTLFARVQANLEVEAFTEKFRALQANAEKAPLFKVNGYDFTDKDGVKAAARTEAKADGADDMWAAEDEESEEPRVVLTNTKKDGVEKEDKKPNFFTMDKEERNALIKEELELRPRIIKAKIDTQARMSWFHLKHAFGFKG